MDLTKGDMLIFSGEGDVGTWERYEGARTPSAIRSRLTRERADGDRLASVWVETRPGVYGKLGTGLDDILDERAVPASAIRVNPAAQLRAGKPNPSSAANGARGGRPSNAERAERVAYWAEMEKRGHDNAVKRTPVNVETFGRDNVRALLVGHDVVSCEQSYLAPADASRAERGLETGTITLTRTWYEIDGKRVDMLRVPDIQTVLRIK